MNRRERRKGLRLVPKVETRPFHVQVNVKRGTAHFIWRYRRQLHLFGQVDFDLPFGAKMPPWISVVFEMLKLRPKHWKVEELARPGLDGITIRVSWLGWKRFTRRWS